MSRVKGSTIWRGRMRKEPSELHVAYCAGWDVRERAMADALLIPYDLWVNRAHALVLLRVGVIDRATHGKIQRALDTIERRWRAGRWQLDPRLEDVHVNIERAVAQLAGEKAGGWLHTGRSRNDQTATDMRLFVRDALLEFQAAVLELIGQLAQRAGEHIHTVMPGLSHTQPSCVTTLGHVLCSHAQAFLRDAEQMRATYAAVNLSPLGAAAGYGTSWPIDRAAAARFLGFDGVQENSIDCVSSRWEMEARCVADFAFTGSHMSLLAQDLMLWSQPWVGFIELDDRHVTGSSIMPQKRNPDFAEVTRAKVAVVHGALQSLLELSKGLVSGYNRDSQWSKYLFIGAFEELRQTPAVFGEAIAHANIRADRMAEAAERDFLVAVDLADLIARRTKTPFRKSYEIVARLARDCEPDGRFIIEKIEAALARERLDGKIPRRDLAAVIEPANALKAKKSVGGPAPKAVAANLRRIEASLKRLREWNTARRKAIERARENLRRLVRQAL